MVAFKVKPDEMAGVLRSHARAFPEAVAAGALVAAHRGRTLLVRTSPVDTGMYKNAWRVVDLAYASERHVIELDNDAPHAGIIELGARPHKVSRAGIEAIAGWVRRKLLRGGYAQIRRSASAESFAAGGGKRKLTASAAAYRAKASWSLDEEATKIAWAIAKKIEKEGQKPTYHLLNSLPKLRRFLIEEVNRQVERVLKRRLGIA